MQKESYTDAHTHIFAYVYTDPDHSCFPTQAHLLREWDCGIHGWPDIGDRKWLTCSRCGGLGDHPTTAGEGRGSASRNCKQKRRTFLSDTTPTPSFCLAAFLTTLSSTSHFASLPTSLLYLDHLQNEAKGWGFQDPDQVLAHCLYSLDFMKCTGTSEKWVVLSKKKMFCCNHVNIRYLFQHIV